MALTAGMIYFTLEFAKDLKDSDWFGKQDPYCILQCGSQTVRTKTAVDGGKNPVWNETFQFQVVNENSIAVTIRDQDVGKDDTIGVAHFSLARARDSKMDHLQIPVQTHHGKQRGFVSATITFTPNTPAAQKATAQVQQHQQQQQYAYPPGAYAQAPYPGYPPQPYGYGAPPPMPYGAPQQYAMPQGYAAPQQYAAPPPQYAPQPGYGAPQGFAPQGAPTYHNAYPQSAPQYPNQYPARPY